MLKKIGYLIAATIISPVVVNFVVSTPRICNYPISGDSNAWIGYWATLAGSLLSVFVAYVVLKYTISDNRKRFKTEIQVRRIEDLKKDLAYHLSFI